MRRLLSAILLSLTLISPLQGATLAEGTSGDSTIYVVDSSDLLGPAASGISPNAGSGMACANNFTFLGEYSTITDVTLHWSLMIGTTQFTAGIWVDPDQDGIPDDAVLLAASALTPAVAGEYLQEVCFAAPQYIGTEGTSFFVGVFWQEFSQQGGEIFMGKDRPLLGDSPSYMKSWTDAPPDPSDLGGAYNYRGTHRAFVIRPTGVVPEHTVLQLLVIVGGGLARRTRPKSE